MSSLFDERQSCPKFTHVSFPSKGVSTMNYTQSTEWKTKSLSLLNLQTAVVNPASFCFCCFNGNYMVVVPNIFISRTVVALEQNHQVWDIKSKLDEILPSQTRQVLDPLRTQKHGIIFEIMDVRLANFRKQFEQ